MPHRKARDLASRMRRWVWNHIPHWIREHDFELFTLLLCFGSGLPLIVSDAVEAASLEAQLPAPVVQGWAVVLVVAPLLVWLSIWKAHTRNTAESVQWMRLEALALRAMWYAAGLYGFLIVLASEGKNVPAAAFILAFAGTCWLRSASVTNDVEEYLEGIGA